MSWSDIEDTGKAKESLAKQKEKAANTAQNYAKCFSTDEGQRVLQDLVDNFIMSNDTSLQSQNVNYEAAYHNGEAGLVKYILKQLERAKVL